MNTVKCLQTPIMCALECGPCMLIKQHANLVCQLPSHYSNTIQCNAKTSPLNASIQHACNHVQWLLFNTMRRTWAKLSTCLQHFKCVQASYIALSYQRAYQCKQWHVPDTNTTTHTITLTLTSSMHLCKHMPWSISWAPCPHCLAHHHYVINQLSASLTVDESICYTT
jgi:hypothetical protein